MDGVGYYAPLASVLFDRDLNLANEIAHAGNFMRNAWFRLPDGRLVDPYPVGAAILWSPAVAVVLAFDPQRHEYGLPDRWRGASPGFERRYVRAVALATALEALAGAALLAWSLRSRLRRSSVLAGVVGGTLGTPLVYYACAEPSYAHTASFLAASAFLLVARLERCDRRSLVVLGALWGLLCLVRSQDAVLGVLAAPVLLQALARAWRRARWRALEVAGLFLLPACIVFLPQVLFWQRIYGQPLVFAAPNGFMHWSSPAVLPFLLSTWQGAFVWSPLLLAGIAGVGCVPERRWRIALWSAMALEIYVSSAAGDWWGSASFGARRLVVIAPLAGFGVAFLFERLVTSRRRAVWVTAVLVGLVAWNVRLAQYSAAGWLPLNVRNVGEFGRDFPAGHPYREPWGEWDYARLAGEFAHAEHRMWAP